MQENLGVVYSITNIESNKIYIGQTIDFNRRKWEHLYFLRNNKHKNHYMQEDYNKYGMHSFKFNIEKTHLNREERLKLETELINFYGGIENPKVYNYQDNINENKEMRALVSNNQKGKIIKQESIEKMRKALTGRKLSAEHIQKIKNSSKKFIGDNNPAKRPEVRQKISNAVKGENNGFYGKHHTEQAREKIRQSRLGKSPANKGSKLSQEVRKKISKGLRIAQLRNGKIDLQLLRTLYNEYTTLKTYKDVAKLHPELGYKKVRSLILKCNDYLEIE